MRATPSPSVPRSALKVSDQNQRRLDHDDCGLVAECGAPLDESVAGAEGVVAQPDQQRNGFRVGCAFGQQQAVAQLRRDRHAVESLRSAARARIDGGEVVGAARVLPGCHAGQVGRRTRLEHRDTRVGAAREQLRHRAFAVLGVEPAVDVQHEVAGVAHQRLRAGVAHRVVPQALARREPPLRRRSRDHVHVPANDALESLPVAIGVGVELVRQQHALLRRQLVERLGAAEAHLAAQRGGRVRGDDREPAALRGLDQRAVAGAVIAPRPRAVPERGFVDLAREVRIECRLHVALEHLHGQYDLAAGALDQRLVDREFETVRALVEMRLAKEDDLPLRERLDESPPRGPPGSRRAGAGRGSEYAS
jgi:hypothetical protein